MTLLNDSGVVLAVEEVMLAPWAEGSELQVAAVLLLSLLSVDNLLVTAFFSWNLSLSASAYFSSSSMP